MMRSRLVLNRDSYMYLRIRKAVGSQTRLGAQA